jgi:hypothetical protein
VGVARDRYGGSLEPLLGELQFAFVAFVYGQSLDGFSQVRACACVRVHGGYVRS